MRRTHASFIAAGIFFLLTIAGCSDNNQLPGGSGLIEATEVIVSAQTAGQIMRLDVIEGDHIAAGDSIGMIDTLTVSLQLKQANAALEVARTQLENAKIAIDQAQLNFSLARKEFDRAKSLIKTGSMNQQQYDKVENGYNQAQLAEKQARAARDAAKADISRLEASINLLEKQYRDCFPDAPITGVVSDKYVEVGELAAPGKPLIKISKIDTVKVKVYLPPADLTKIKLGGKANIDPEDGRSEPIEGNITWISSTAEFTPKNVQTREARANLVYAVEITIANNDEALKVGMPVSVTIP